MYFNFAAVCLLSSWLMPLHFLPWVSWHSDALAFLAVLLAAWSGLFSAARRRNAVEPSLPLTVLPLLGLALLVWLQAATGIMELFGEALVFTLYLMLCIM